VSAACAAVDVKKAPLGLEPEVDGVLCAELCADEVFALIPAGTDPRVEEGGNASACVKRMGRPGEGLEGPEREEEGGGGGGAV
jgi:hypothetical protein